MSSANQSAATPHRRRRRARRGDGDQLRDDILAAAERLLLETGDEHAVSIRAVAAAVGVTPPSIYLHFPDKDTLLVAVCEGHFRELAARMTAALDGIPDAVERLKARGRAYVAFGLEHPEPYRILFMRRCETTDPSDFDQIAQMVGFDMLLVDVADAISTGALRQMDSMMVATQLWTALHGLTAALIANLRFPWPASPRELTEAMINTLLGGLAGHDQSIS